MYSSGEWSETISGVPVYGSLASIARRSAIEAGSVQFAEREIVLITLDDLLLAIHEVDVVAKKEMKVFRVRPRKPKLNRIELQQQVISERADQDQLRILRSFELVNHRPQKWRSTTAACSAPLPGICRQRLQFKRN